MKNPELPAYDHEPRPYDGPSFEDVSHMRKQFLSPSLLTYYQNPIMRVEGSMQHKKDAGIWMLLVAS